jgi:anthranilate synthase component 1
MSDPRIVTPEESFVQTARAAPAGARVPVEVRVTVTDPFEAYRRARTGDGEGFYFETTGGQSGWGYFGIDPVERVQVSPDAVTADGTSPSIEAIDALLDREQLVRSDCTVPYPCGAFGWLSYDIARELETLPATTVADGLPRLQLGVFDRVVAWEEPHEGPVEATARSSGRDVIRAEEPHEGPVEAHVTACPVVGDSRADAVAAYETGVERAMELATAAVRGDGTVRSPATANRQATFQSECGREAFAERVRTIKQYVRDGDTFQTNVSHRLVAPVSVHPVETFDALRRVNPAPYSALLEFPGVDLVSASPELLLDVDGDRLLTEPIAGTRPRGDTPGDDADLERELATDEKERAEHAMLVDLERNDLGKVSEYGSVEVSEYRRVDRYSEVMHLVSLVEGRLRDGESIADAVAAVFPGGTITGAPKPRTMEIIDEVERSRRGPYTGSIGVFGFDDRATMNITIRTLVRHEGQYRLRVGSGIVHDSVPEREYQETLDKARALVNAVDEALGEQGSFVVESGTDQMEGVR